MSSTQWRTGVAVPPCRCVRQPMFAVAIACGAPASSAASLRARSSPEIAGWFDDAVALHDTGKASPQFQAYIPAPEKYRMEPSTVRVSQMPPNCTLRS